MKKLLYISILLLSFQIQSQVGINTTTPNAQLDIRSSNQAAPSNTDGVLIPKINAFPSINPTVAQQGMLVYLNNTTVFSGNTKVFGFYYWDAGTTDWIPIGNNNTISWSTIGNASTSPLTNFIGTTDNVDLIFRRNNTKAGSIGFSNTAFGNGSLLNPSSGIGNSAFGSDALNNITTGNHNTAIGISTLNFNQVGNDNIAVGLNSLFNNRTHDNLAIGNQALFTNQTGENNVAIGNGSLQSNISNDNTAIGYQSQLNNTIGSDNVSLGKNSLLGNSSGNRNTAIGNNSLSGNFNEDSTAIGYQALAFGNSLNNTAVGSQSMFSNIAGVQNTAVGKNSLSANTGGQSNSAFGFNSLKNNISGNNNTGIGFETSTLIINLQNATAIGANAAVGQSNSMVLGSINGVNNSSSDTNVGIGTSFPSERLHIVGNFRMEDGNQGAGKILASNATGVASWQNASDFSWGINGNSNINPSTHFIGTTNFVDVIFKRANNYSGIISNGVTAFGHNSSNLLLGGNFNCVFGADAYAGNGQNNSAFGYGSLRFNFGINNSSFGTESMPNTSNGSNNVAIGYRALFQNDGNRNTAVGTQSSPNLLGGENNTAIGESSLRGISSGSNNTGLGYNTNFFNPSISNSTSIGALAQVNASNSMVLGSIAGVNGATSSVNVGIGTTTPQETLHIEGKIRILDGSQANGRILTSDGNGTGTWINPIGITNGSLDQAYDFGGAGLGRTITADTGAVLINGTDGIHSTGTLNSGATLPISGAGVKMLWYPRKAAFRAGRTTSTQWDDASIGLVSMAFGSGTTASATNSTAFGTSTTASNTSATAFGLSSTASGDTSIAFGSGSTASGTTSTAFGAATTASGATSTAFGSSSTAIGQTSTAFGVNNGAESYGETVIGIRATTYTPSLNGATQFRSANATDRLFTIGNAIDANNNGTADAIESSDAMIVLKNGLTRLPSTTNAMITAADGKAVVTKEYLQSNNWSLTGNASTNPATNFIGTTDDVDLIFRRNDILSGRIGDQNTFFGKNSGVANTGGSNTFIGERSGIANVSGDFNTFLGRLSGANGATGDSNTYVGYASGLNNTGINNVVIGAFASQNTSGNSNVFIGISSGGNNTTGTRNLLLGENTDVTANNLSNAIAIGSKAEVGASNSLVLGSVNGVNGATSSVNVGIGTTTPDCTFHVATGTSGATPFATSNVIFESNGDAYQQFLTPNVLATNGAGLLFGTPAGTIRGGVVFAPLAESLDFRAGGNTRRMVIDNAGNIGIGITTPSRRLHVSTGASGGTPNANGDFVLESNGAVYSHLLAPSASETGLLFGSELTSIHAGIVCNSVPNPNGFQFRTGGNTTRMVLTNVGDVGIGTIAPGGQLELSLNEGRKPGTNTWTIISDSRLKTINGTYTKGLNEILQLNPIRFNYKNVGERIFEKEVLDTEFPGFIAQEVQPLFPDAVGTDADGFLNFNIHPILIASVNAIKELNAKNSDLQTENEKLKTELSQQKTILELLLQRVTQLEQK